MARNGWLRSFHMLGPAALETEWSMNSSVSLPAESFHLWELVIILVVVEKVALAVGSCGGLLVGWCVCEFGLLGSALLGPAWLVGRDSSALIMIDAVLDFQGLADYNDRSRTCRSLLLAVYQCVYSSTVA